MFRTALIMDINDLYFSVQKKFGRRKLIISAYLQELEKLDLNLVYKVAYNNQRPTEAPGFVATLEQAGFEIHYDRRDWSIAMALRAAEIVPYVESFVLGTAEFESGRILRYAKNLGKLAHCYASGIPAYFRQFAQCKEIDEGVLSDAINSTKPLELHSNSDSDAS